MNVEQRASPLPAPAPSFTVRRGFTLRQAAVRTCYEIISRPIPGALFALSVLIFIASLAFLIVGAPFSRIASLVFAVASAWSISTPIWGTITAARKQSASWRVGEVVTSGSSRTEYWIRTPHGEWRYDRGRLALVRRLFGFVIVEVDGNEFYHIAIPGALWIEPPLRTGVSSRPD